MSDFTEEGEASMAEHLAEFTDYRCVRGHVFSVPWGAGAPRSTVVCPKCGATGTIHFGGSPPNTTGSEAG